MRDLDSTTIRSYGPGKFNSIMDSAIYCASLDGCDEELSCEHGGFWYGKLSFSGDDTADSECLAGLYDVELNAAEVDHIREFPHCILYEDSQGFVDVDYYATEEEVAVAWDEIENWYYEDFLKDGE